MREKERERKRERERMSGRGQRERGREIIPSRLHVVSTEPNTGFDLTTERDHDLSQYQESP